MQTLQEKFKGLAAWYQIFLPFAFSSGAPSTLVISELIYRMAKNYIMELKVVRYSSSKESTLGLLFIDGVFACYTLEDEHRAIKVIGETRIPAGRYRVKLRAYGGHHWRYLRKYGTEFHQGMLQIVNVPGFTDILIHKGNDDDDTAGCLLVGDSANNNQVKDGFIGSSTVAYNRIYAVVRDALINDDSVYLQVCDIN